MTLALFACPMAFAFCLMRSQSGREALDWLREKWAHRRTVKPPPTFIPKRLLARS